jgi:hypothetical protein
LLNDHKTNISVCCGQKDMMLGWAIGKILPWLQERIKHWIKPATSVLIIGALSDLTCSRADLVVENVPRRQ